MASVGGNIRKGMREPGRAYSYVISRLQGTMLKLRYSGSGGGFVCGANFRVRGRLVVHGPGKVVIGDDVLFEGGPFNINTLYTYDSRALISVGSHTFLNGLRIGCHTNVAIGKWCIVADARITDSDDHPVQPNRWDATSPVEAKAVVIEDNVWIGLSAIILKGVRIGRNSVVAAGSVVTKDVSPNTIVAGNPARPVREFGSEEIRAAEEFFRDRDRYEA